MATVGTEELISDLCRHYGIAKDEITKGKRCEGRKAGIYLMKKYTAASNSEIGAIFGNLSYSAVAKTYQNFAKQMELDEGLRARIKGFLAQNSITKV